MQGNLMHLKLKIKLKIVMIISKIWRLTSMEKNQ